MANRFVPPFFIPVDGNGNTLSMAKLYFFQSGTLVPLSTFSDSGLTNPNTHPVVANGDGRFPTIFLQAADYDVVLDDAADVNIWTENLVSGVLDISGNDYGPSPQDPAAMTVLLLPGSLWDLPNRTIVTNAAQTSALIIAPSVNPRIDVIFIDRLTGVIGVMTGVEAASPSVPTIPVGKLPVANIALATTTTTITTSEITDVRELKQLGWKTGVADGNVPVLGADGFLPAVGGTFGRAVPADKTTNYAIVAADVGQIIPFDSTAAARIPTLPLLSSVAEGFSVGIARAAGANTITVNQHATDGGATIVIIAHDRLVWIAKVSGGWMVLESYDASLPVFTKSFQSTTKTLTASTVHSAVHGFGVIPKRWEVVIQANTTDNGWGAGQEIVMHTYWETSTIGQTVAADAGSVYFIQGAAGSPRAQHKTTAAVFNPGANWDILLRAWI